MFERFTSQARQVVVGAQEEARELHSGRIGTEHLLLGLLADEEIPAAQLLGELGVSHAKGEEHITAAVAALLAAREANG
jgi:ATP-dependent Clp protease ATP-binding subunit ClpA